MTSDKSLDSATELSPTLTNTNSIASLSPTPVSLPNHQVPESPQVPESLTEGAEELPPLALPSNTAVVARPTPVASDSTVVPNEAPNTDQEQGVDLEVTLISTDHVQDEQENRIEEIEKTDRIEDVSATQNVQADGIEDVSATQVAEGDRPETNISKATELPANSDNAEQRPVPITNDITSRLIQVFIVGVDFIRPIRGILKVFGQEIDPLGCRFRFIFFTSLR